jgi:hypothetical protein
MRGEEAHAQACATPARPAGASQFLSIAVHRKSFGKIATMGVTIELHNLGDSDLCREITARIEHALDDKPGEWRVSIAGSLRERESGDARGPNGFERTYTLSGTAGEHRPHTIRWLILQLVPVGPGKN